MQRGPVRETRTRRYDHFSPAPFFSPLQSPIFFFFVVPVLPFCRLPSSFPHCQPPLRAFSRFLSLLVRRRPLLVHFSSSRLLLLSFLLTTTRDRLTLMQQPPRSSVPEAVSGSSGKERRREREKERPLARARRTYCYRNERPADKRSPWMTNERVPLA